MSPVPPPATPTETTADVVVARLGGWGRLALEGADAATFLHGQLSTDVEAMPTAAVAWTSYNSPKGRMLATLLLWRRDGAAFEAFLSADLVEYLRKRLALFVLRAKVAIAERSTGRALLGVAGPAAGAALARAVGGAPGPGQGLEVGSASVVGLPDGRFLVDLPAADADAVASRMAAGEVPASCWDWLSVRAGVPLITLATQDRFVPQAANFDLIGGVNFRKGCYPGQEIVARMQYLGRLKERLFAWHVEGEPPVPGMPLFSGSFGEQAAGTVVNAAPAPGGGSDFLAVTAWSAVEAGDLRLATPEGRRPTRLPLPYEVPAPAPSARVRL